MKNLQGEKEREGEWESPTTTPHARPIKATIVLIRGTTSLITVPSAEVIGTIKPSCERQSN